MLTHRVPHQDDRDQREVDLAAAAHAAAGLSDTADIMCRAHRTTRALARLMGEDVERLRRCVDGCRHQAERTTDSEARALWHRAERLSWNALMLIEALGPSPGP